MKEAYKASHAQFRSLRIKWLEFYDYTAQQLGSAQIHATMRNWEAIWG